MTKLTLCIYKCCFNYTDVVIGYALYHFILLYIFTAKEKQDAMRRLSTGGGPKPPHLPQ